MTTSVPISVIDSALLEVAAQLPGRLRKFENWQEKQENHLWRELVGAILGSAVSFDHAVIALVRLDAEGLNDPSCDLNQQQVRIERCLRLAHYRFPALRSRQIAATAAVVYGSSMTLKSILASYPDAISTRRVLVDLCQGIGPKQASLFLRNVGYHDLAVLDRHVLTYLYRRGLVAAHRSVISSLQKYEALERVVMGAAARLGLTIAEFDLAVWITVRAVGGDSRVWDS